MFSKNDKINIIEENNSVNEITETLTFSQKLDEFRKKIRKFKRENKLKIRIVATLIILVFAFALYENYYGVTVKIYTPENKVKEVSFLYSPTVIEALAKANIQLEPHDSIDPSSDTKLLNGETITLMRAKEITVNSEGRSVSLTTGLVDAREILKQAGFNISDEKISLENLGTKEEPKYYSLLENEKIYYTDVPIAFSTSYTEDSSLAGGQTKVTTPGENGSKRVVQKISMDENGNEIKRETLFEQVVKEPTTQIIAAGKNSIIQTSGGTKIYRQKLTVTATGYCPCMICCGKTNGITASGAYARANYTIATSSSYSFGTKFYIPYFENNGNGGVFEVQDRGGAIQGNKIDIYFNTHQEALNFGRRNITVYVLE